jgi:hypothetical protein
MVSIGLEPQIEAIESGAGNDWAEAERRWIKFYRNAGARLSNTTDGGEGTPDYWSAFTREQRRAVVARRKGMELLPISAICRHCGAPYLAASPGLLTSGQSKFCGKPCQIAARTTRLKRNCPQCGAEFVTKHVFADRGQGIFCSIPCANQARVVDPVARFWSHVVKHSDPSQCWGWAGSTSQAGYALIVHMGQSILAHRLAWEIHFGPIPEGMFVCHKCDNPPCCNPHNLFLGTRSENSLDMHHKGRARVAKGAANGHALLSDDDVQKIRRLYAFRVPGRTAKAIAKIYGVSSGAIFDVVNGRTWSDVGLESRFE